MNDLERYNDHITELPAADFMPPAEAGNPGTSNLVASVFRRWYIMLIVFLVMCTLGIPAIWFLIKPLYYVTGAIELSAILPNILTGEADRGEISNYQNFVNTQAESIVSDQVVQRVADDLSARGLTLFESDSAGILAKLKRKLRNSGTDGDLAEKLKNAIMSKVITAKPARHTELIKIAMGSHNIAEAEQIVNAFINAYMAVKVAAFTQEQNRKLNVLQNKRKMLLDKMQRQRQSIRQLAHEYGTTTFDSRQNMMLESAVPLLEELTRLQAREINLEIQVELLENSKQPAMAPGEFLNRRGEYIHSDPVVLELTRTVVTLEQELIVARQALTPTNPELKLKAELLETLKAYLAEQKEKAGKVFDDLIAQELTIASSKNLASIKEELQQVRAHGKRLQEELAKQDAKTIELGRTHLQIEDLQFQYDLDKKMFDTILRRIQEVEMEGKRPARVSVAKYAELTDIRDKRIKYTMALVMGAMFCGAMLALWRDKADLSLQTPADVTKKIGIRIIGTTTKTQAVKRALLPRQIAEDYRTIRANLGLLDGEGMPKKLVVTSPAIREGKTTFAINLATSIARSGKKVLLIDGDLRKPDIAGLLGLPKDSRGLQDVLFEGNAKEAVCSVVSLNLDVLAAGYGNRSDSLELLALPDTVQRINKVSERYDHVIIDTPPVLAFVDALVWAKMADAVILTGYAGQTTAPDLKEAKDKLSELNVRVLGMVLTNVRAGHSYYRYDYTHCARYMRPKTGARSVKAKALLLPMRSHDDKTDSSKS